MGTVHEDAALALLEEWDSDPEGVAILPIYVEGLRTGRWARDYLDAIGQLHRVEPFRWPRHQVAAFALMHHYLMSGLAASVQINVDGTPYPDAERDANASALADLPAPFTAHLSRTQHHADQDGWLEWHSPITANRSIGEACYSSASDNPEPILVRHVIPPGRVPLRGWQYFAKSDLPAYICRLRRCPLAIRRHTDTALCQLKIPPSNVPTRALAQSLAADVGGRSPSALPTGVDPLTRRLGFHFMFPAVRFSGVADTQGQTWESNWLFAAA